MAITLSQNEYANTLSNLIALDYVDTTISSSSTEQSFLNRFTRGTASYGDNVIFRTLKEQLTKSTTLDTANSDLLKEFKQAAQEENLVISKVLRYRTTLNSVNIERAFMNGSGYSSLVAEMRAIVQESKRTDLFNYLRDLLLSWIPTQAKQTIKITASESTSNYAPNTLNMNKIARILKRLADNLNMYTSGYTDTEGQYTKGSSSKLVFVWNANYKYLLETESFALLYNNTTIKNMLWEDSLVLPDNQLDNDNSNTVGWLIDERKLVMILGGNRAGTFLDIATDNEQIADIQYHNEAMLKNYIGIKIVADFAPEEMEQ